MKLNFRRFKKLKETLLNQSGSMTFFVVIMFTTMIGVAGIAIDIARFEANRTQIQSNLDNATLAAASLRQTKTPQQIVDSYMIKAGLEGKYQWEIIDTGTDVNALNTVRRVETRATMTMDTMFMKLFGVNDLGLTVLSSAEESIPRVEISLVLDISGSMGSNGRLTNLIPAAQEFVDLMLAGNDEDNPNRVSISLVPYNMQVNAGEALFTQVYGTPDHNYSYCAEWEEVAFTETGFSTDEIYEVDGGGNVVATGDMKMNQSMHMGYYNSGDTYGYGSVDQPYCRTDEFAQILPLSNDAQALKDQIGLLEARGNTSIDIGAKWGIALLDPDAQSAVASLASMWQSETDEDGNDMFDELGDPIFAVDEFTGLKTSTDRQSIEPGFVGRPVNYNDETLKVMVLMTDGQNTTEYRVKPQYRGTGGSGVYYRESRDRYKLYYRSPPNWVELSWNQMWGVVPVVPYYNTKGGRWTTYWDRSLGTVEKNDRLSNICSTFRAQTNAKIYTIAYSATTNGINALFDCAGSSDKFAKIANTTNISDTFAEIGQDIQKLRLTF
tara:strand:+ start:253 stop:1908 length:1656 start_codon:yes stop_codon:yes gene_type:complete